MRTANSHSESVKTHLETFLTGLDSSDVTSDTTTNDDHIVLSFRSIAASEASIYGQRRSSNEARRDRLRAGSAEGSPRCRPRHHTPEHCVLNVEEKKH
jgi:hypothetical protein